MENESKLLINEKKQMMLCPMSHLSTAYDGANRLVKTRNSMRWYPNAFQVFKAESTVGLNLSVPIFIYALSVSDIPASQATLAPGMQSSFFRPA